jgi:hypothetical protein
MNIAGQKSADYGDHRNQNELHGDPFKAEGARLELKRVPF